MEKRRKINPTQMCAGKKVGGIDACWVNSPFSMKCIEN